MSHALCPYVQRAAIVLLEKDIPFERVDVDLSRRPRWFTTLSPLGKTPLLLVDEDEHAPDAQPLFESAVICEYLDETTLPRLHPADPMGRARHRAWMEFGSAVLNDIATFYNAADEAAFDGASARIDARLATLDATLHEAGPWFAGPEFSLVDAVFAPVFRYFSVFERWPTLRRFLDQRPRLQRWRRALGDRPSVQRAVAPDFESRLADFMRSRPSFLGQLTRRMGA